MTVEKGRHLAWKGKNVHSDEEGRLWGFSDLSLLIYYAHFKGKLFHTAQRHQVVKEVQSAH